MHAHTHIHTTVKFDACGLCRQVSMMKKIAETSDLSEVVHQLQKIASCVLNKNNIRYNLMGIFVFSVLALWYLPCGLQAGL